MKPKITIIGAGIAGLSAAFHLHRAGFELQVIEATDRVGGRIKTDIVNGFRLDRGFQVLLTAYPEAKAMLDYKKLNLKTFLPGATVLYDGGQFQIADPFRRPTALFATIFAPVGSLKDKINTFLLKHKLLKKSISDVFTQKQKTSQQQLVDYGFSQKMINQFYKPFFSGIFLENNLETPNRMFDFVMKMFSEGDAAVPALGMEEIPKQLAAHLPKNCFLFDTTVQSINNQDVVFQDSTVLSTDIIIVATQATQLVSQICAETKTAHHSVTNVYFEADFAPTQKAVVVLNASKSKKYVNNLTVMTNVSPEYAPQNKILISVSCNGISDLENSVLSDKIKLELNPWFGAQTEKWAHLKTYKVKYALPKLDTVRDDMTETDFKLTEKLYVCGDHLLNGSINAAMKSGRLVAEAIIADHQQN